MKINIREFDISTDLKPVLQMAQDFVELSGISTFDLESSAEFLFNLPPNIVIIIAEDVDTSKVVGMICAAIATLPFNSKVKYSQELWWWVNPEARTSTAGRDLHKAYEDVARSLGCGLCYMAALDGDNAERLHKIYARQGYRLAEYSYVKEL